MYLSVFIVNVFLIMNNYWNKFYSRSYKNKMLEKESSFAKFAYKKMQNYNIVVDLACGNARDSRYFYKKKKDVIGVDKSLTVVRKNNSFLKEKKFIFYKSDLSVKIPNEICRIKKPKCFYSRFFIHTLNNKSIARFIHNISSCLNKKDKLFLEYRSYEDKNKSKVYNNHYRNFIKTNIFEKILNEKDLFSIYFKKGTGLAKFNKEDPFVARHIIVKK